MIRKLFKWTIYGVVGLFALVFVISAVASFGTDSGQPQQADKQPIKNTANQEPEKQPVEEKQPPEPKPVDEIRVSGTTSAASCSVMDDAGQRSVDIPVPGSEKIKAGWTTIVGATCQKAGAQGSLKTEIVIDGKVEASQSTSAEFGVVTVTYPQ